MKNLSIKSRFLIAGITNYLFATTLWLLTNSILSYAVVNCCCALISISFSLFTHKKITLNKQVIPKLDSFLYYIFQVFQFASSLFMVPFLSESFNLPLLLIQYMWTASASIVGIIILKGRPLRELN
jgi:hypothetical protein